MTLSSTVRSLVCWWKWKSGASWDVNVFIVRCKLWAIKTVWSPWCLMGHVTLTDTYIVRRCWVKIEMFNSRMIRCFCVCFIFEIYGIIRGILGLIRSTQSISIWSLLAEFFFLWTNGFWNNYKTKRETSIVSENKTMTSTTWKDEKKEVVKIWIIFFTNQKLKSKA